MKTKLMKALDSCRWTRDRFGHYRKTITKQLPHADYPVGQEPWVTRNYRVKIQDRSIRVEIQVTHAAGQYNPSKKDWVRIGGAYYCDMVELEDGRIRAGAHIFGERK